MTDRTGDQEPETTTQAGDGEPVTEPEPAASDRRSFLHHLSRDAVWSAGRVAGFSSMIRRSVFAAGEAVTLSLEPSPDQEIAPGDAPEPTPPEVEAPPPRPVAPDAVLALTSDQHEFLSAKPRAAMAVNDPAGAPHVTSSIYHWDGATFRLPGQQFTLRASNVERDPRVSLLIEDPASGASVAVSGLASVVYGDRVEVEMLHILAKYGHADAALRQWEEMRTSGDRIVIDVRPTRFVWRSG